MFKIYTDRHFWYIFLTYLGDKFYITSDIFIYNYKHKWLPRI